MEINYLELTGTVLEVSPLRYSPTNIPHRRWLLEHRSKQLEAGRLRQIICQIAVQFSGEVFAEICDPVRPGARVSVQGFLARTSHKSLPTQLVFHGQTVKILELFPIEGERK